MMTRLLTKVNAVCVSSDIELKFDKTEQVSDSPALVSDVKANTDFKLAANFACRCKIEADHSPPAPSSSGSCSSRRLTMAEFTEGLF